MEEAFKKKVLAGSVIFLILIMAGVGLTYYQLYLVSYPEELKAYVIKLPKSEILERFPDYYLEFKGPKSSKEISLKGYAHTFRSLQKGESLLIYDNGEKGLIYLFFDDREILVARKLKKKIH